MEYILHSRIKLVQNKLTFLLDMLSWTEQTKIKDHCYLKLESSQQFMFLDLLSFIFYRFVISNTSSTVYMDEH